MHESKKRKERGKRQRKEGVKKGEKWGSKKKRGRREWKGEESAKGRGEKK